MPTSVSIESYYKNEIKAFDVNIDNSTIFVFSKIKAFDTSFILIIKRDPNGIKGKFLYYPPSYYKDFFSWEDVKVFLFKGITFWVAESRWNDLSLKMKQLSKFIKQTVRDPSAGLIHPADYKFYFNNLLVGNQTYENSFFQKTDSLLKQQLVNELMGYYPVVDGKIP